MDASPCFCKKNLLSSIYICSKACACAISNKWSKLFRKSPPPLFINILWFIKMLQLSPSLMKIHTFFYTVSYSNFFSEYTTRFTLSLTVNSTSRMLKKWIARTWRFDGNLLFDYLRHHQENTFLLILNPLSSSKIIRVNH